MTCDEARDLLLEADLDVLRGLGESALAEHLHACAACARLARRLLAGQDAMDRELADVSAARAEALAREAAAPRALRLPVRARVVPWGLAAAAVLALVIAGHGRRSPTSPQAMIRAETLASGVSDVDVSTAAGRSAIVFRTADPSITVVWFY